MRYRINGPHPGVDAAGSGHMMLFTVLLSLVKADFAVLPPLQPELRFHIFFPIGAARVRQ